MLEDGDLPFRFSCSVIFSLTGSSCISMPSANRSCSCARSKIRLNERPCIPGTAVQKHMSALVASTTGALSRVLWPISPFSLIPSRRIGCLAYSQERAYRISFLASCWSALSASDGPSESTSSSESRPTVSSSSFEGASRALLCCRGRSSSSEPSLARRCSHGLASEK